MIAGYWHWQETLGIIAERLHGAYALDDEGRVIGAPTTAPILERGATEGWLIKLDCNRPDCPDCAGWHWWARAGV